MKKRLLCLLLACMLFLCSCGSSAGKSKLEGKGFSSPDKAVLAFLDAMRKGDINGMISTFAIETLVDNMDVAEYNQKMYSYTLNSPYPIRADDAYTKSLLLLRRQTDLNTQLMRQYIYFNTTNEDVLNYNAVSLSGRNGNPTADEFFDDLMHPDWMDTLADMTYEKPLSDDQLDSLLSDYFGRDLSDVKENFETYSYDSQKAVYRFDDYAYVAIRVDLDGKEYCLFMDVVCYDGKWYNFQQGGILATMTGSSTFEFGFVQLED